MLARIVTIITISCFWEITYLVESKPVTHKIKTIFSIIKHLSHQSINAGRLGLSCVASVFILGPDWDLGSMRPGQTFGCISSPFMSAWRDCSCQGALFRWVVCNTGQVAGIVPIELLKQLLNTNCLVPCLSHSSSHHIIQNQFLSPYLFHFSKSIAPNSQ